MHIISHFYSHAHNECLPKIPLKLLRSKCRNVDEMEFCARYKKSEIFFCVAQMHLYILTNCVTLQKYFFINQ